ncbi:MAG: hypothetical protein LRZ84_01045 [Desertifilum sp.]|nr:hypothetical protein [Desertifilum sp.]
MNEITLNKSTALFQAGIVSILLVVATATSLRVGLPAILQANQPAAQTAKANALTPAVILLDSVPTK